MMPQDSFERELTCGSTPWRSRLWPYHEACWVNNIDFPEEFRSEKHSFSGSSSQKMEWKNLHIYNSEKIDFIPVDIFVEFPNLNSLLFSGCNIPIVKSGLFTVEFQKLEYLNFQASKVQSIEETAFEHLVNLKWINFYSNQIKSLPSSIFEGNPNIIYVSFKANQINSINPDLLKNLKLKIVDFSDNQCVDKNFGCETCSVSQSELNDGLSKCFTNYQNDVVCSTKNDSETKDLNSNLQSAGNNLTQEISDHLKEIEETLEETTMKLNRTTDYFFVEIELLKKTVEALQTAENTGRSDAKTWMENERLQWKLREAEQTIEKQKLELEMEKMKREFEELKTKMEQQTTTLKNEFDEIVNKKLEAFKKELLVGDVLRT
jgi:hypothetical protein